MEIIIFVKNLLNVIRSWCESNDLVFNIYGNSFMKATKNINKEYKTKILDKQIRGDDKDNLRNIESDVSGLLKLRKDYINNPSIGYLNINRKDNLSEKFVLKLQLIFYALMKQN